MMFPAATVNERLNIWVEEILGNRNYLSHGSSAAGSFREHGHGPAREADVDVGMVMP